jgi:hypothetical protein
MFLGDLYPQLASIASKIISISKILLAKTLLRFGIK